MLKLLSYTVSHVEWTKSLSLKNPIWQLRRKHNLSLLLLKTKSVKIFAHLQTLYFSQITVGKKEAVVENNDNNLFDKDLQDITA